MNTAGRILTRAKGAIVSRKYTQHTKKGEGKKMEILSDQKQQTEKMTEYRFGDDERELTAEEKEAYAMAEELAGKIHRAAAAAAGVLFRKMTYKEFKRAFKMPEWVKPEEYYFFSKSFYQAYCWGYEEGEEENNSSIEGAKE